MTLPLGQHAPLDEARADLAPSQFIELFEQFRGASWSGWRNVLSKLTPAIRELYFVVGRGAGKSIIIALLIVCFAARPYRRAPGEKVYAGIAAPDRRQAAITRGYVLGLLRAVPQLAALIVRETSDTIELSNGVVIEIITASAAAPRGRAYCLFVVEEAAFLPNEDASADPDVELLRAVRPALARVPGSLLAVIGSPYARRGVLYDAVQRGCSEDRLVIVSDTATLNPSFDAREIARAWRDDPVAAASEYGSDGAVLFRSDVSSLMTDAVLAAVVPAGLRELDPQPGRALCLSFDGATGAGEDSAALGGAYAPRRAGEPAELAVVRRWPPPHSPVTVAAEVAAVCRRFGARSLHIDRFAPGLIADLLREHGIRATVHQKDTSGNFIELLSLVNSQRVRLLDDLVLLGELRRLERRTGNGGRDSVGHPPRGHDDVAAACAGALVVACGIGAAPKITSAVWGSRSRMTTEHTKESLSTARRNRLLLRDYMRDISR